MNKSFLIAVIIITLIGLVSQPGCKSAEDTAQYTLSVSLGEGVTGTPATGSTTHEENSTVNYSYTAQSGYGNLAVTLDGAPAANSGTVNMTASHTLDVTAIIDVRGDWTGQFRVAGQGESNMRMTFSGGILSGDNQGHINALDAPGREAGTFTIDGNQIEFEMHYVPGTILFQGTIEDVNHMSGTWRLAHDPPHGTWTLERSI